MEVFIVLAVLVFLATLLIYAIFRKKINFEEEKDYNKCLEIISKKRKFVGILATIILIMIPIWYILFICYTNLSSHTIIS